MFTIRTADKNDAMLIADISRSSFYETFAASNTKEDMDKFMNEQFTREKLMAEVNEPGNIFLLAFIGDQPAGYVRMRESKSPAAFENRLSIEIARIYVTKNFHGLGLGNKLMKKCISIAEEMNREIIWLGVWEKNEKAIAFYNKWGFEKFGEHDFILGNDIQRDWLMKKSIIGNSQK